MPGTYSSSTTTSWLTATPKMYANPGKTKSAPNNYGVGSTSPKGLFRRSGFEKQRHLYLTKNTYGDTWNYNAAIDSVIFTGWLSAFKTRYFHDKNRIIIYTGDVKRPDKNTLNITYTEIVAKEKLMQAESFPFDLQRPVIFED